MSLSENAGTACPPMSGGSLPPDIGGGPAARRDGQVDRSTQFWHRRAARPTVANAKNQKSQEIYPETNEHHALCFTVSEHGADFPEQGTTGACGTSEPIRKEQACNQ
jgi:hypothetical protein